MKIGVDVDGVLRDMMTPFIKNYNNDFNDAFVRSPDDVKDYDLKKSFPSYHNGLLYKYKDDLFKFAARYVDSKGFVDEVSRYGDVYIVSAQPFGLEDLTLGWLRDNEVLYKGVCFLEDKSLLDVDYLVDDCPKNVYNASGVGLGVRRPWNQDGGEDCFMSLDDVVSYIKEERG